jgi:hypothetical protein
MSHQVLAEIVIPIVVAIGLAVLITLVLHANRHPRFRRRGEPRDQTSGGSFVATGGRQVTPRPDAESTEVPGRPSGSS